MISGGQTKAIDIKVGRQLLCKEKPGTPATSACAKKVTATVTAAKKGLTPAQQKLWQKYVYTSALLQVSGYCRWTASKIQSVCPDWTACDAKALTKRTQKQVYAGCISSVLAGKQKFSGLFKTKFKWTDFLIKGAKMIKKLPQKSSGLGDSNVYKGTNPNR